MMRLATPPASLTCRAPAQLLSGSSRGFSSEKQLKIRIRAVKGIEKITKAVYMVASAKMRKAEARLTAARNFAAPLESVWETPQAPKDSADKKRYLVVPVSSDRGLCGSFNAAVVRDAKDIVKAQLKSSPSVSIITYGEKVRAGLLRTYGEHFAANLSDLSKLPVRTFKQTAMLASYMDKVDFDAGTLIFQRFKSMLGSDITHVPLAPKRAWEAAALTALVDFEIQGDVDTIDNLIEFRRAVTLWRYLVETDMSELTSRMNAMNGASKNTKEMMGKLQLYYNKARQGRITAELVEVVSGATAADEFISVGAD